MGIVVRRYRYRFKVHENSLGLDWNGRGDAPACNLGRYETSSTT